MKAETIDLFDLCKVSNAEEKTKSIVKNIEEMMFINLDERVNSINKIREALHSISPFNTEPVDFVRWVKNPLVHSNDYNPNSVAPPEMELLRLSISSDGYTQPIVAMLDENKSYEVIDGFHRHRVGKECGDIQSRVHGYLPLVQIKSDRQDKNDRMASTIRHNRARGKHKVEAMSDIVIELKRRNWSDEKIAKELGMEADEVLRLCLFFKNQIDFSNQKFQQICERNKNNGLKGGRPKNPDEPLREDKIREDKNRIDKKVIGSRFTLTEPPVEWIAYCEMTRPDLHARTVFEGFRDYWIAKAGKDGVKLDWLATWRNWIRNQKKDPKAPAPFKSQQSLPVTDEYRYKTLTIKKRTGIFVNEKEENFMREFEQKQK